MAAGTAEVVQCGIIYFEEFIMKNQEHARDGFRSRWGFTLACVGSAVGMGNIWRFPYMVSEWGGLTFLIPYFIFVILIGATGVIEEIALGRSTGAGPIGAFGKCTEIRTGSRFGQWIGAIPVVGALCLAIGYTVVVGWIFKYTFMALTGGITDLGQDMDVIGGMFGQTASAWGNNMWLIIAVAAVGLIMIFGIAGGIERVNKVMMPALFCLFVILGIYIMTLPGSNEGYKYIFTLEPAGLLEPELWIFAFGQAFFSLSIAGNGTVIYGSYLGKNENVIKSARNIAVFDSIASMLATLVIVPSMAVGGAALDTAGPGLMFIYLVNVFNGMPGGTVVGIIFYVCVMLAGITSLINLYEVPVAALQEKLHMKRVPAVAVIAGAGCVVALFIQAIVSGWMDAVSIYVCPLGAMLAGIMFFYVAGKDYAEKAVNEGADKPIGPWFVKLGKYVFVPLALIALVAGAFFGGIG